MTTEPRYKVGDTVYVRVRYPNNIRKPFVKGVIEEVYPVITEADLSSKNTQKRASGHQTEYALDRPVKVGKDLDIGYKKSSWFVGDFHMYPAKESYLHLIGDSLDCYFDLPDDAVLREDMIEED